MRKIVFALSVVLTVMTACEDNNDSTVNGNRSAVPFSKIQLSEKSAYEAGVPTAPQIILIIRCLYCLHPKMHPEIKMIV